MALELSQESFDKIRDYVVSGRQKEAISFIRNEYELSENAALHVLTTVSNMVGVEPVPVPPAPTPPPSPPAPQVKKNVDWSLLDKLFAKKDPQKDALSAFYGTLFALFGLAVVFFACGCAVAILPYSLTFDSLNAEEYNRTVKAAFYIGGVAGVAVAIYIYRNEYLLSYKQDRYESRWYDIVPIIYALILPSRVLFLQLESFFFYMVAMLFSIAVAWGLMRSKRLKPGAKLWISVVVTSVATAVGSGLVIGVRPPPSHEIIAKKNKIESDRKASLGERNLEVFQNQASTFEEKKKAAKVLAGHMKTVSKMVNKFEYLLLSTPTYYKREDIQIFSEENWYQIEYLHRWNGLVSHGLTDNWIGICPFMFEKMIEISPHKTYDIMKKDSRSSHTKAKYWREAYVETYLPGAMVPFIQSDDFSDIELALKNKGRSIDAESLRLWETIDWKAKFPDKWEEKHSDFLKSTIRNGKEGVNF